jgi:hypothetical protein
MVSGGSVEKLAPDRVDRPGDADHRSTRLSLRRIAFSQRQ